MYFELTAVNKRIGECVLKAAAVGDSVIVVNNNVLPEITVYSSVLQRLTIKYYLKILSEF